MTTRSLGGRQVLMLLVAFFGVILAVNGAFLFFALRTHPGLDTADAYRKGLSYNATIAAAEAERVRGWTGSANLDGGVLTVRLADKDGRAVAPTAVEATLRRPARADLDRTLRLEARGAGVYAAPADPPLAGLWAIVVRAERGDGSVFAFEQRLEVR